MDRRLSLLRRAMPWVVAPLIWLTPPLSGVADASQKESIAIEGVSVSLNGETLPLEGHALVWDDRLFVPVAPLARWFGATVEWDPANEAVTLYIPNGDRIVMSNGVPVVYVNDTRYRMDTAPFLADGKAYLPFRQVAGLMGASVAWAGEAKTAELALSEEAGTASEAFASVFEEAEPYTEEDYLLLAKLVPVEGGYESYEGQLAIANVVLNRVKDERFPASIREVIYSGKQFPPAHNGLMDRSEPNDSVLRAVKDALNGKNNVEDAVYFFNPDVTSGSFWNRLEVVADIENHSFAK
ncbi:cell wall hydrolase [Paenibacillus sp. TRM 82003]|nr:cell wall hydrolase [Paenibacillus sp. TRM 82003]